MRKTRTYTRRQGKNFALIELQVMAFLNSLSNKDEFLVKKISRTKEFKAFVNYKEVVSKIPQFDYFIKEEGKLFSEAY